MERFVAMVHYVKTQRKNKKHVCEYIVKI